LCSYKYNTKYYQNDHPDYHDVCILSTASINSPSNKSTVTIYPNPTTDIVSLDLDENYQYRYQIMDLLGRSFESGVINNFQIDVSGYSHGIYVITIYRESDRKVQQNFKVIKY